LVLLFSWRKGHPESESDKSTDADGANRLDASNSSADAVCVCPFSSGTTEDSLRLGGPREYGPQFGKMFFKKNAEAFRLTENLKLRAASLDRPVATMFKKKFAGRSNWLKISNSARWSP
jgi:hypothetical protein